MASLRYSASRRSSVATDSCTRGASANHLSISSLEYGNVEDRSTSSPSALNRPSELVPPAVSALAAEASMKPRTSTGMTLEGASYLGVDNGSVPLRLASM